MKNYFLLFTCFLLFNSYSQTNDTVYFLINKNDTLIKQQIATKKNNYEGYCIIDENKIIKRTKRSIRKKPADVILKKGEIWFSEGDYIEFDDLENYSFSFYRKNDTLISKSYLDTLNFFKDRRQFIDFIKQKNIHSMEFVFIEPTEYNKFVLRKVYISTFE